MLILAILPAEEAESSIAVLESLRRMSICLAIEIVGVEKSVTTLEE